MSIGQLINMQMHAVGISQNELARRVGKNRRSIQRYIAGAPVPEGVIHKMVGELFEKERERIKVLRQWTEGDALTHEQHSMRRRKKMAKTQAKRKFFAEIDFVPDDDSRRLAKRSAYKMVTVPIVKIFKKSDYVSPYWSQAEIIRFSHSHGFDCPLGEGSEYFHNENLALEDKIVRYEQYCEKQHLACEGLLELAREAIEISPMLSSTSYQRDTFCLIHSQVASSMAQDIERNLQSLTSPNNPDLSTHQFAIMSFRRIARELRRMEKAGQEADQMRSLLLKKLNEVSKNLNPR